MILIVGAVQSSDLLIRSGWSGLPRVQTVITSYGGVTYFLSTNIKNCDSYGKKYFYNPGTMTARTSGAQRIIPPPIWGTPAS